jgi:hypothetical protein
MGLANRSHLSMSCQVAGQGVSMMNIALFMKFKLTE